MIPMHFFGPSTLNRFLTSDPLTFNQRVLGSSPSALTNNLKGLAGMGPYVFREALVLVST